MAKTTPRAQPQPRAAAPTRAATCGPAAARRARKRRPRSETDAGTERRGAARGRATSRSICRRARHEPALAGSSHRTGTPAGATSDRRARPITQEKPSMFRQFATRMSAADLFDLHPVELACAARGAGAGAARLQCRLGHPDNRSNVQRAAAMAAGAEPRTAARPPVERRPPLLRWDHLIYAYMIENTRVYEIFRRVVVRVRARREARHADRRRRRADAGCARPRSCSIKDGAPFLDHVGREPPAPRPRGNRRNAYQRMFDMELNHGTRRRQALSVRQGRRRQQRLRRHLRGAPARGLDRHDLRHRDQPAATRPIRRRSQTSRASCTTCCGRAARTATCRARSSRSSAAMSWFHLTLRIRTTPIVRSLRADATGTEQRLFKIAERVGLPAHGLSKHFFDRRSAVAHPDPDRDGRLQPPAMRARALHAGDPRRPTARRRRCARSSSNWTAITGATSRRARWRRASAARG